MVRSRPTAPRSWADASSAAPWTSTSQYKIDRSALAGENKVVLRRLQLGERVESPGAMSLPLDLAIAILSDSQGRIDIALPVRGNVDQSRVHLRPPRLAGAGHRNHQDRDGAVPGPGGAVRRRRRRRASAGHRLRAGQRHRPASRAREAQAGGRRARQAPPAQAHRAWRLRGQSRRRGAAVAPGASRSGAAHGGEVQAGRGPRPRGLRPARRASARSRRC